MFESTIKQKKTRQRSVKSTNKSASGQRASDLTPHKQCTKNVGRREGSKITCRRVGPRERGGDAAHANCKVFISRGGKHKSLKSERSLSHFLYKPKRADSPSGHRKLRRETERRGEGEKQQQKEKRATSSCSLKWRRERASPEGKKYNKYPPPFSSGIDPNNLLLHFLFYFAKNSSFGSKEHIQRLSLDL